MKMRPLVLLALVVSACGEANRELPVSPSAPSALAGSPSLLTDSSLMPMMMAPDDPESLQDLSFEAQQDDSAARLDVNELDVDTSAAGNYPARPVILSAGAKGTTVTFTWKNGTGGGAPTTYVVLYKGLTKMVGLSTSFSFPASPGRYVVVVYGRNAAGNGPPATTEVSVAGGTGNYDGSFGGSGFITRSVGPLTCRWTITYKGNIELLMNQGTKTGLTGIMRLMGSHSAPKGTPIRGNVNCLAGSASYTDIKPVIISGTNIARTGLTMGWSTGTFSGNLVSGRVTGTLKAVYKNGPGTLVMPVTLRK